jgi:hypothetical protein
MSKVAGPCVCCGKDGVFSIQLAYGPEGSADLDLARFYLPNQGFRDPDGPPPEAQKQIKETWFCAECMRAVEDAVRATILYRQAESLSLKISGVKGHVPSSKNVP